MLKPLSVKVVKGMKPCDKKLKAHLKNILALTYDAPALGKYVYILPGDIYVFLPTKTALNELKIADWGVATLEDGSNKLVALGPDISSLARIRFRFSHEYYYTEPAQNCIYVYFNGILYYVNSLAFDDEITWLKLKTD